MSESKLLGDIKSNWKFLVLIFLIGVAYSDQKTQRDKFNNLEQRVQKKIKIQNDLKEDIKELQLKNAFEEGYKKGANGNK